MPLNTNMSLDGKERATIQISFRLSFLDIFGYYIRTPQNEQRTKKEILNGIRHALKWYGYDFLECAPTEGEYKTRNDVVDAINKLKHMFKEYKVTPDMIDKILHDFDNSNELFCYNDTNDFVHWRK